MNNILTASRMASLMKCPRQHFWQFEIGLRKDVDAPALRFGSAWARAMESRWKGASYDEAFKFAVPEENPFDELTLATLAAMLQGYYDYWASDPVSGMMPELKFEREIGLGWKVAGVMDSIGLIDGRETLIEHKTTSDSLAPDSDYWTRLRFNLQILQYASEAMELGHEISQVFYDVVRKPSIRPKNVGKGEAKHVETPDEFGERLLADIKERPDFYFARREIPILHDDVQDFLELRETLRAQIEFHRMRTWSRHVSSDTCDFCPYASFCLQNAKIDLEHPPFGFSVKPLNPELNRPNESTSPKQTESNKPSPVPMRGQKSRSSAAPLRSGRNR